MFPFALPHPQGCKGTLACEIYTKFCFTIAYTMVCSYFVARQPLAFQVGVQNSLNHVGYAPVVKQKFVVMPVLSNRHYGYYAKLLLYGNYYYHIVYNSCNSYIYLF